MLVSNWTAGVVFILFSVRNGCCLDKYTFRLFKHLNLNKSGNQCEIDLRKYIDGYEQKENWTEIISSPELTNVSEYGFRSLYDFGLFDTCINAKNGKTNFIGKYCLGTLDVLTTRVYSEDEQKIIQQMDIPKGKWGICIPSACEADQISSYLGPSVLNFNETHCQVEITKSSSTDIITLIIFGTILLIIIGSTLSDICFKQKNKDSRNMFLVFSYFSNGRKLFRSSETSTKITCLSGIQTLSIFWLTLGHFYLYTFRFPIENTKDVIRFISGEASVWMLKSDLCIDTIFLVAGILMTTAFLNMSEINLRNIASRFIYRYARLTVPLLALIMVHISLLKYIGSGPMWTYAEQYMIKGCSRSFWSTVLYLRNFINSNETCVDVSWYLALNMQIFTLSPLILIPLKKYPKAILSAIVILACVCIQMSYYSAWKYKLRAFSDVFKSPAHEKRHYHYHIKIIPSLMGILVGYSIYKVRSLSGNFHVNKILLSLLWITSTSGMAVCILGGHNLLTDNNRTVNILYVTFIKPIWVIALSWIIFACDSGLGGPVNAFLSLSIFRVLGKLSYCMYLLHSTIYMTILYSNRFPIVFTHASMLYNFISYFALLLTISIIWSLSFELPVASLAKYFAESKTEGTVENNCKKKQST